MINFLRRLFKSFLVLVATCMYIIPFILCIYEIDAWKMVLIWLVLWLIGIWVSYFAMSIPDMTNQVVITESTTNVDFELGWKVKQIVRELEKLKYVEKIYKLDFDAITITIPIRIYTKFGIFTYKINNIIDYREYILHIKNDLNKEYEEYSKECF